MRYEVDIGYRGGPMDDTEEQLNDIAGVWSASAGTLFAPEGTVRDVQYLVYGRRSANRVREQARQVPEVTYAYVSWSPKSYFLELLVKYRDFKEAWAYARDSYRIRRNPELEE
jgi:hypothetical protein